SRRMRTENTLWWLAIGCAVLLLIAPFTPRTTWLPTARSAGGSQITEGVGWLAIAALLGIAALVALVLDLRARRGVPAAAAGAAAATVAFAVTAVGMGRHWLDLMNGITSVRMHPGEPWALHPAPLAPHFAVVAAVGAALALALTIRRLQPVLGKGVGSSLEERVA
ncbi:MAG: hypothetical protein ACRDJC_21565, partial [Thermomicrobiales bacterium]